MALEPIAGAALAVNLAYLALTPFRYRRIIQDHAEDQIKVLTKPSTELPTKLLKNKWFRQVERLARLPHFDELVPNDNDQHKKRGNNDDLPAGMWGWVYTYVFERHQDRILSFVMTAFALFVLVIGVAHSINHLVWIRCWFSGNATIINFYLTLVALFLPIIFVILGRRAVHWATYYATECIGELEQLMQDDVQRAALKEDVVEILVDPQIIRGPG